MEAEAEVHCRLLQQKSGDSKHDVPFQLCAFVPMPRYLRLFPGPSVKDAYGTSRLGKDCRSAL